MKLDILAIGIHPDDVEISAAGTLLRHLAMGKKVGILDLSRGEMGTRGSAETRDEEAAKAAADLGVSVRAKLNFADCFFAHDNSHIFEIVRLLRYFQPEIVLANAIEDRHPDHGRAAKITADACFYSGLPKMLTEWEGKQQMAYRPKALYHYIQDRNLTPDFVVDVSPYMEQKIHCLKAYESQFYNPSSQEPVTPISGADFFDYLKGKAKTYGRSIGVEYGEGFTVSRTLGVTNLFDFI